MTSSEESGSETDQQSAYLDKEVNQGRRVMIFTVILILILLVNEVLLL